MTGSGTLDKNEIKFALRKMRKTETEIERMLSRCHRHPSLGKGLGMDRRVGWERVARKSRIWLPFEIGRGPSAFAVGMQ